VSRAKWSMSGEPGTRVMTRLRDERSADHHPTGERTCSDAIALYENGTFLHTSYVTVYYALTLWEAYMHWPLSGKPVAEVYDDALAEAPFRPTTERAMRFELELEKQTMQREVKTTQDQMAVTKVQAEGLRRTARKSTMAAVSWVVCSSVAVMLAVLGHLFSLKVVLHIPSQSDFWTYVAFAVPLCCVRD
jgi:hypothetical protein